jgi:DEAD/DEAH box helicase domain-containing protein
MDGKHLVIDVEIKNPIVHHSDWKKTDTHGVACAVTYDVGAKRYKVFDDTSADNFDLKREILHARRVTTFNGWSFDLPVIWGRTKGYMNAGRPPGTGLKKICDDVLMRIWNGLGLDPNNFDIRTHGGVGLDQVCKQTLGVGKTGHGKDAPLLYRSNRWGKLISYCMDDVKLTTDLMLFIEREGYCIGKGRRIEIPTWRTEE